MVGVVDLRLEGERLELAVTEELSLLVSDLAEQALQDRRLLMRPIPYFDRLDRFRSIETKLALELEPFLVRLSEAAARRVARSYAFADELSRDVLWTFCTSLREDGQRAQRTLWAAAVLLDQILDEEAEDPALLAPVRVWVRGQTRYVDHPASGIRRASSNELNAFVSMLESILADCHQRTKHASEYAGFHADLMRMLDAELSSPLVKLSSPPDERVRRIVSDKSVLLCWVGFRSCLLGDRVEPWEMEEYRKLCEAVGEILWIMDDLADIQEDLGRGVWNRTLWRLYDSVGETRFREVTRSGEQLAEALCAERIVERAISEIAERVEFMESHSQVTAPATLRSMLMFWIASWMGIYA